ncbi:multiple coagulation factor deficiency protein 2 homolog isoform X2 [Diorhabda carinulata]|uniref:multiple coagulation factor deficiency protein 2 homolog isoform X2 n=1 Tax=Diorhabda carinulata TaxID=1163345 RepID=UPI0025A05E6F|nr:multiple coagulation factor deficiency protein 2 homolog isoform X2 [Diorhabda carinulata]
MVYYYILLTFYSIFLLSVSAQVAPGVPPQRYQQPPQQYQQVPQQQYQQQVPQQQYQQVPQQQYQQQVPQQQYQQVHQQENHQIPQQQFQQVPQHQVPAHQGGTDNQRGHHHNSGPKKVLNAANVAQEAQHIQEHMDVPIDTSKMTEQELQFHYFKMHDADNNNKLDGCELIKSLIHWHAGDDKVKSLTDKEISNFVDDVLTDMDKNKDGFISYVEYRRHGSKPLNPK